MPETIKTSILIADDDKHIRDALQEVLISEGYSVYSVDNGEKVLRAAHLHSPSVILLDISMPGLTGLELIELLKNDNKLMHIPVVIITGQKDMKLRIQALQLGADDFLTKPPHRAELSARVKTLVKVKNYHDHLEHHKEILEKKVMTRTKQLRQILEKLKITSLETIFYLSRAAEYRDEDTSLHIHRVSQYASLLAHTIGLDKETVETIMYASPMHDIGKIGIPDRILLKPGKLTAEEWDIMKSHSTIGGDILEGSNSKYIQMGHTIAITHHEKWDGSGYPSGLRGNEIPVEGRITAIADVFDALTSRRPYKEAFAAEDAFKILEEERNTHFDPHLIDAFLSRKNEILGIKKTLTE